MAECALNSDNPVAKRTVVDVIVERVAPTMTEVHLVLAACWRDLLKPNAFPFEEPAAPTEIVAIAAPSDL